MEPPHCCCPGQHREKSALPEGMVCKGTQAIPNHDSHILKRVCFFTLLLVTLEELGWWHHATTATALLQQRQWCLRNDSKDASATTLTTPSQQQWKLWQRCQSNTTPLWQWQRHQRNEDKDASKTIETMPAQQWWRCLRNNIDSTIPTTAMPVQRGWHYKATMAKAPLQWRQHASVMTGKMPAVQWGWQHHCNNSDNTSTTMAKTPA